MCFQTGCVEDVSCEAVWVIQAFLTLFNDGSVEASQQDLKVLTAASQQQESVTQIHTPHAHNVVDVFCDVLKG